MSSSSTEAAPGRSALVAASIVLGVLLPLAVAELALRLAPVISGLYATRTDESDPIIRMEPNRRFTYSIGPTFDVVVRGRINNAGWVNDQDYDSRAATPLLAVVGDSYVEALMVPFGETIGGRLAESARAAGGRVYTFGASGAPLSQYLMMARHARDRFKPDAMVIVVVGNDFDESLISYKAAPGMHGFVESADGELELRRVDYVPSRWRRLARRSALVRYLTVNVKAGQLLGRLRTRSEPAAYAGNVAAAADETRMERSRKVIDTFVERLPEYSGVPPERLLVVVDGVRPQLYDLSSGDGGDSTYFGRMRSYLMERAASAGYEVVDMQPIFIERFAAERRHFDIPNDGHWNASGHALAAAAVERSSLYTNLFNLQPSSP
jgi:hypothetical protein